jgi:hypothetical protein
VTSLRDAAWVLKLPLTDREVIDNIADGLSPQQPSRFVSKARPTTWADINRQCIHDRNVSFAEGIRLSDSSEGCRLVSEDRNCNEVGRNYPVQTENVGSWRRCNGSPANVTCFYYKKVGMFSGTVGNVNGIRHLRGRVPYNLRHPADTARSEELVPVLMVQRRIVAKPTSNLPQVEVQYSLAHFIPLDSSIPDR